MIKNLKFLKNWDFKKSYIKLKSKKLAYKRRKSSTTTFFIAIVMGKIVSDGEKMMGLCVSDRQSLISDRQSLIIYHIKVIVKSCEIVCNPKTNLIKLWALWPILTSKPLKCYSASI